MKKLITLCLLATLGFSASWYFYPLNRFEVNLGTKKTIQHLAVDIQLKIKEKKSILLLDVNKPEVRYAIILALSNLKYQDIETAKGKIKLANKIKRMINENFKNKMIKDVYFTYFNVFSSP